MLFSNKFLYGFMTSGSCFFLLFVTLSKALSSIWKVTVEGPSPCWYDLCWWNQERPKILQYNFLLPTQSQTKTLKKNSKQWKNDGNKNKKTIWGKKHLWNKFQERSVFFILMSTAILKKKKSFRKLFLCETRNTYLQLLDAPSRVLCCPGGQALWTKALDLGVRSVASVRQHIVLDTWLLEQAIFEPILVCSTKRHCLGKNI